VYQCRGELSLAAWRRAHVANLIIFILRHQNFNRFRDPHPLYELVLAARSRELVTMANKEYTGCAVAEKHGYGFPLSLLI